MNGGVRVEVHISRIRTITSMLYAAARALGLVDPGWKVDLVDRSIRCGEGDPELADALQREAEDKFR